MKAYRIEVTDTKGKYPPKVYEVQAEEEFLAYGEATEQYIKDNNHPAYKVGQSASRYYSRFLEQGRLSEIQA